MLILWCESPHNCSRPFLSSAAGAHGWNTKTARLNHELSSAQTSAPAGQNQELLPVKTKEREEKHSKIHNQMHHNFNFTNNYEGFTTN